ncbi:MAG: nucleotidyl transferase AbiEii/AbiGii toxin family protein [Candidatus Omnitrophica bacterium]|nr:nucleotidyl transferase AbiEii/AbiGii toxin family protein [Candidatus Omnitrophota bacterium]MDD5592596.1 nucleotidyl transferase AbiEii/AbiGii toxin family protein [Candidatus Omnitrophota bacterium]
MKDYVLELVSGKEGYNAKLNIMREYLQAYILRVMHDEGVFRSVAFLGGTALRFLHGLPRFSEDLDFSLVQKPQVRFEALLKKIMLELSSAGYDTTFSYNDKKAVNSAFIKFSNLMFEAGVSPLKSQKFSIKIEIDNNPPQGAVLETQLVNKYFPISFLSYDTKSLFTGKLHALLCRKYAKGRDYFDLGWYLSKWKGIEPNFLLFKNGLQQTGWSSELPDKNNWRGLIYKVVERADWKKIKQDVEQFLENPSDLNIVTRENVMQLLQH